jgi:hypothetical protein
VTAAFVMDRNEQEGWRFFKTCQSLQLDLHFRENCLLIASKL